MSDDNEQVQEDIDHAFVRTQETANYQKNREEKNWEAIRDDCDSGGAMDDRCNIIAASTGRGKLDVVAKRLSCGCLLVAVDELDALGWEVAGGVEK